jgi:hypothetical protein
MKFQNLRRLAFAGLLFVGACGAKASNPELSLLTQNERDHLTIRDMKISQVDDDTLSAVSPRDFVEMNSVNAAGVNKSAADAAVLTDKIINIGQKIWTLVEKGKPVLNEQLESANALPEGVGNWQELEGWQAPVGRTYKVSYENLFGIEVVRFNFRLLYTYGGSYRGKGLYLTHVAVMPADVHVAWGYHLDASGGVPSVTNAGTSDDPVAGAQVDVRWNVKTVLKEGDYSASYFVRGDGAFKDLNN